MRYPYQTLVQEKKPRMTRTYMYVQLFFRKVVKFDTMVKLCLFKSNLNTALDINTGAKESLGLTQYLFRFKSKSSF